MLLSKVWSREPEAVRRDLERMRGELSTDRIDVVLMHCVRNGEENWPETLRGAMDVLSEAKAKGHIRAHGVSCHSLQALERVPDEPWVDVVLARVNPFGVNMDGPPETVAGILKRARAAGKGLLGMKILGEGKPEVVAKMEESFRFAAEVGVDAMTIGFIGTAQMDEVMGRMAPSA
jgi:predicted aldo/keto reductase-like oxidoreductase